MEIGANLGATLSRERRLRPTPRRDTRFAAASQWLQSWPSHCDANPFRFYLASERTNERDKVAPVGHKPAQLEQSKLDQTSGADLDWQINMRAINSQLQFILSLSDPFSLCVSFGRHCQP